MDHILVAGIREEADRRLGGSMGQVVMDIAHVNPGIVAKPAASDAASM